MAVAVNLVFGSWPGGPDGPFIEAETDDGRAIALPWTEHDDGSWSLRITIADIEKAR